MYSDKLLSSMTPEELKELEKRKSYQEWRAGELSVLHWADNYWTIWNLVDDVTDSRIPKLENRVSSMDVEVKRAIRDSSVSNHRVDSVQTQIARVSGTVESHSEILHKGNEAANKQVEVLEKLTNIVMEMTGRIDDLEAKVAEGQDYKRKYENALDEIDSSEAEVERLQGELADSMDSKPNESKNPGMIPPGQVYINNQGTSPDIANAIWHTYTRSNTKGL